MPTLASGEIEGSNLGSGRRIGLSLRAKTDRLGVIGSTEDTPSSLASSPANFFCLPDEALGFDTSSSPLDTSTSMGGSGYSP
jgi:hypothetical protein